MEQIPPKSIGLDNKFVSFGERLRAERVRIGMQQQDMAIACGVARKTLSVWEKGEQTPTIAVLARMSDLGIDPLFVVTGRRNSETESTLTYEEKELLSVWRSSGDKGRTALTAVAEVLKQE